MAYLSIGSIAYAESGSTSPEIVYAFLARRLSRCHTSRGRMHHEQPAHVYTDLYLSPEAALVRKHRSQRISQHPLMAIRIVDGIESDLILHHRLERFG